MGSKVNKNDVYGRLTVTGFKSVLRKSGKKKRLAVCVCECGGVVSIEVGNLVSGNSTKCSECANKDKWRIRRTHGHSLAGPATKIEQKCYYTWQAIKRRCGNEGDSAYLRYGGRGISVCAKWIGSYEQFLNDMRLPPSMDHQIDRTNNDGNYEPSNCKWVSRTENARNKSNNKIITAFGKSLTQSEWAEKTGITRETIAMRLRKGMSAEDTLSKCVGEKTNNRVVVTPAGTFSSISGCSKYVGLSISGVYGRINSKNYPDWQYN